MKYLTLSLFFFINLSAISQDDLLIDWKFTTGTIYNKAIQKYLSDTKQSLKNSMNYDPDLPIMGIYLIQSDMDTSSQLETLTIRFCYDDSWKQHKYDRFCFYGSKLLLINKKTSIPLSEKTLESLIQDRVYARKKKEDRMITSRTITARDSITFEIDKYDGWYSNANKENLLREPPYLLRKLMLNHNTNSITIN